METTSSQNPNANFFQPGQGGNPFSVPTTSSTITPESLQPVTPIQLPQPSTDLTGGSNNTSIPNPTIPTAESIINTNTNPTPAETQQTGFLNKIASLISGNKTQTTLQNEAETSAGVPALTTTLNDLNTQLEGLNNQSTALQNDAQYTIPNKAQEDATGRGITTGGLAPLTTSQLRQNQIKQGAIATQALTLKSAIYGAQGKYNIAKDAADKAATAQYEQQQQEIDYQKAQLDAIMPTLNKEEKAQALIQQSKLADRQTAINNGIEDKKTIIALATAALKNYPDDSAAHYAAQQALAESNKDKPDLATALSLVGRYQTDPMATQKAIADLAQTRAQTQASLASTANSNASATKTRAETALLNNPSSGNIVTSAGKPLTDAQSTSLGYAKRVDQSSKIIDQLGSQFTGANSVVGGLLPNTLKSEDRQKYEQAQQNFVNAVLRKESGAAIAQSEFDNARKQYFPQPGDTQGVVDQKKANRDLQYQNLLQDAGNPKLPQDNSGGATITSNGKQYIVGQVYNDGTANWTVDGNGKWTKQ